MGNWEANIRKVVPYVPGEQPKEQDIINGFSACRADQLTCVPEDYKAAEGEIIVNRQDQQRSLCMVDRFLLLGI